MPLAPTRSRPPQAGAGGVGVLLTSWVWGVPANTTPANLPSHPHHHLGYADVKELKESDLKFEAPRNVSNSMASLLESYVGPAGVWHVA